MSAHVVPSAVAPATTLARVRGLFGPLGITRVANVTGLDHVGIPVVMVFRPNSRSLAVSPGKGVDLDAAKASGVMESIELYHAERVHLPLRLATWNEMRFGPDVVDVHSLPHLSTGRFESDRSLLWIEGTDLRDSRSIWLPFEVVHTNFTLPLPPRTGCLAMGSNGLASGNTFAEAVSHALCEVIERDAATLFHCSSRTEQNRRRVDLDSIEDSTCRNLLDLYAKADLLVGVWDITSDVGVPSFRCVIVESEESAFRPLGAVKGMGCHPNRAIALRRALTEAAQGRLTLISGARDDLGRERYSRFLDPEPAREARECLLERTGRPFDEGPEFTPAGPERELKLLLRRLEQSGHGQAIVVDLSKPQLGVPVARVVVPGLEAHFQVRGYLPGARAQLVLEKSTWPAKKSSYS